MMKEFDITDLQDFKANHHSRINSVIMSNFVDDRCAKHSQWVDGKVKCIVIARNVEPYVWWAYFLMAEDYQPAHGRELKSFIQDVQKQVMGKELITVSVDDPELNRWHKFLGFKCDQPRGRAFGGKDYNLWRITWGDK